MKPGDLYRIRVPLSAHPKDDFYDGELVIFMGGRRTWFNKEIVYCLHRDVPKFIYVSWLEDLL